MVLQTYSLNGMQKPSTKSMHAIDGGLFDTLTRLLLKRKFVVIEFLNWILQLEFKIIEH